MGQFERLPNDEAIATIEYYQSWRMGDDAEMIHPKILTKALNIVLDEAKKGVLMSELNTDENIKQILP